MLRPVPDPPPAGDGEADPAVDTDAAREEDHPTAAGPNPAAARDHTDAVRGGGPDSGEDEGDEDQPQPVDPPQERQRRDLPTRARAEEKRSPVLPPWLRDWQELRLLVGWLAGYVWHKLRYHGARIPVYLLRLAGYTPRGIARTLRAVSGWLSDAEAAPLRREAVDRNAFDEYMHLAKLRRDRLTFRSMLAAPPAIVVVVVLVTALTAGVLVTAAALVAAAVVFGLIGAPADKPVFGRAVATAKAPRLTSDLIVRALAALGIAQINAAVGPKGTGISFPAPIVRDGPGWRAEIDLPYGVTVTDIMDRRDRLASGLRRPLGCVWPAAATDEHEGRLVLWVGDTDLAKAKPAAFPLAKQGQADLFGPIPFGTDQRGRPVTLPLMFANILIGAMPRMGKTFALRVVLLACALDPTAELRLFELKGTGDLGPLEPVAHHYASGADDETLQACMASLREIHKELNTRAKTIRKLPRDVCPENKVTPDLAARRSLGLHPIVVAIDECQELFSHPDFKDEADRLATAIIKRGPAMGIMLVLATQRPDAKSLPTGVSANAGIRFCLRVMGQVENDMVLGTSMYKNGVRATTFTAKDKGIGYLVGADDDPIIARSYYIDGPAADSIAARARSLRERAGTLSGHAIGEVTTDEDAQRHSLIDDLAAVLAAGEDKVWSETLCDRLAGLRPDIYDGWAPAQLAAALKPYGITTRQVWGTDPATGAGRNRYGVHRADIVTAIRNRQGGQADD
ncbi:MAG: cell division protein FtsK [Streptosporangiales bacterium]|nr:cell division protein FtsK [Streptosporangiales bacterium]